jgi:glutamate dehydrogenase (NADP+)
VLRKLNWSREEVDEKLLDIMRKIHKECVYYGKTDDGYVNYVKGANIAGFLKVAYAMLDHGVM